MHPSADSSTIEGALTLVKTASATTATFDVADGAAANDLVVSALINDHEGGYAGMTLVKTGAGTMVLSGASTFAGNVTVADGVVVATSLGNKGAAGNLGAGTTVTLGSDGHNGTLRLSTSGVRTTNRDFVLAANGSGTIELSDYMDISGVISGDGDLIKTGINGGGHNDGARLSLGGANSYTGDTYIMQGVIQTARNGGAIPDTSNVYISAAGGGRLRLVYYPEAINGLFGDGIVQTFQAQNLTLTVGAAGGDGDFSGTFEPGIALVKAGAGTQVLRGNSSTYAGGTTINGGTLLVNNTAGSGTGTGAVLVNPGGTLGGSGFISGAVSVLGTIAPGNSVDTLSTGSETWAPGGDYLWEINDADTGTAGSDPGWDLLDITGTLTVTALTSPDDQRFTIDVASLSGSAAGDAAGSFDVGDLFLIARTTDGVIGFDPGKFLINTDGLTNDFAHTFAITSDGTNVYLGVVPEPSACVLAALGALALGLLGGRRGRLLTLAASPRPTRAW